MKTTFLSLSAVLSSASAFNVQPTHICATKLQSSPNGEMEIFERAVECAEKFGVCDIEKMEELAKELEEFNGAYFESADEDNAAAMMQKEVNDRRDIAEILKLQGELRLRMDYLDNANLFAHDVHQMAEAYPELD
eukprot:CAMPEP_0197246648 /NCGR_PEP_ID=MMETSP1429-20130617/18653_1 /TAXON_ID=49237 /ORGANISM="Chaetoceros  sp., Strain UNC1202" /LENGTH=134 /DNA_ID=CAMNT_0042707363 /DNA_START=40 /DNA_END=444 /DNA_ORIENTATION=+